MQHFLKGAIAAIVLAPSMGAGQVDLSPLNSDSAADRADRSEPDAFPGRLAAGHRDHGRAVGVAGAGADVPRRQGNQREAGARHG